MIQKNTFILLLVCLVSCTHSPELINSQSYLASREKVWKVIVAVFKSYPLKSIDEEKGYLETEELKANQFWSPPHQENQDFSGYSSVIQVQLNYDHPLSWVYITKKIYKQKGFISSKMSIPSDQLEESIFLYRIGRELHLQTMLNKLK